MPRRNRLTSRVHRHTRRSNYLRNIELIIASEIENRSENIDVFDFSIENIKCAITSYDQLSNFEPYNIGAMDIICEKCNAVHFELEKTSGDNNAFSLCCHKGKVKLNEYTQNQVIRDLIDGLGSSDAEIKKRSKNYFQNIRSYNASFAMLSSEAQIDESVANGVYMFKIHNVFYHRAGTLTTRYADTPRYAQLYFYDVDTANQHRLRQNSNVNCDRDLMRLLSKELYRINKYVQSFRTMAEYCEQNPQNASEMSMIIKVDGNDDMRRYNDAVQTDVAVIFRSVDGEPPYERNMIIFSKNSNVVRNVSILNPALDPLAYPLLFPNGDEGWHINMRHDIASTSTSNRPRNTISQLQYASYRLAIRPQTFSILHRSQKLFLQWIVDIYVRVEGGRLHYIKTNQSTLRAEVYNNLTDYLHQRSDGADDMHNVGRQIILPSSFVGSPRNMYQNYLDAMSIVQHFGKPSLFITMTCNPNWPEIKNNLIIGEQANFRPDLIVRVFKCKLKELMDSITKRHIFGKVAALIYTIEFQKRGLPHAHILITLEEEDKIREIEDIDNVVCAELPDPTTHPLLHQYVKSHMMHGPCGILNQHNVCMRDGECSKKFPKKFNDETNADVNGFPVYRRRDSGITVDVRGHQLDNTHVVPYNPYLLAKFNCHINVEICTSVKSIKYIYKYVYKGYDCASIQIQQANGNDIVSDGGNALAINEIEQFLNGRYVGSTEANWRINEYPMHFQTHSIVRLDCHLPNRQTVIFRQGEEQNAANNIRKTKLLAFFILNEIDSSANNLLYADVPLHYVWIDSKKEWKKRQRGSEKIISRLYCVTPKDIELFHLRLLLLHVRGPKSFEDLRTHEGVVHRNFVEACYARSIATNDNEWKDCLDEAKETKSPKQLRELFGFICGLNLPTNAKSLWNEFKIFMSEDYLRLYDDDEAIAFNKTLIDIEEILLTHNTSCIALDLPVPDYTRQRIQQDDADSEIESGQLFLEMYEKANVEQKAVIDLVLKEVVLKNTGSNVICLTAHAGCGKTYVQTAIIHQIQAYQNKCIATAFSGIAATLLIGGRTLHNVFKLPIHIVENTVLNISVNSADAENIREACLIIIDEVSMCPLNALRAIDRFLKDLLKNDTIFGGKTMLLCGDFRQTLPVLPRAGRVQLIENCITSWVEFEKFHKRTLKQNMRANPEEVEYVEFLKTIGDGTAPTFPQFTPDTIEIPQRVIGQNENIINDIYGDIRTAVSTDQIIESVILAPKNDDCTEINNDILKRLPGEEHTYHSYDRIVSDDIRQENNYPVEFLNTITISSMPPHKLVLKKNVILLLIRNLNTKKALVNGTRLRVKQMHRNNIECEVLTGLARGQNIIIPRIHLDSSSSAMPFEFRRTQFPVIPAFAMTINKSQGQTFQKIGILLKEPVFAHGQLYVAASRVRSFNNLRFYISKTSRQGQLIENEQRIFTSNIVYREILQKIN